MSSLQQQCTWTEWTEKNIFTPRSNTLIKIIAGSSYYHDNHANKSWLSYCYKLKSFFFFTICVIRYITIEELQQALREFGMNDGRDIKEIISEVDADNVSNSLESRKNEQYDQMRT